MLYTRSRVYNKATKLIQFALDNINVKNNKYDLQRAIRTRAKEISR